MSPKQKSRAGVETVRPGVHRIRWECRKKSGQRVRRTRIVYGTRKQAERRRRKEIDKAEKGLAAPNRRLTFGAMLDDHFDEWCQRVSARTLRGYRCAVRTYLTPELRDRVLEDLMPSDLQKVLNAMTARGLSPSTVRGFRAVLRRALNRAMKLGLVERNVATLVDLPRTRRREIQVLSTEQTKVLLAAVSTDRLAALWSVLATVGLRPSEAFGLMWEDLDGCKLRVRRSLVRVCGQPWQLAETKTGRARVVVLPGMTERSLAEHRTQQKRERLEAGDAWQDVGLIFTTPIGTPLDVNNLRRYWYRLLRTAGLPRITLYGLRHTAATLRLANGEHPKLVQELLGHASITLTMDTYSHVLPAMQEASAERLDALLSAR